MIPDCYATYARIFELPKELFYLIPDHGRPFLRLRRDIPAGVYIAGYKRQTSQYGIIFRRKCLALATTAPEGGRTGVCQ